MNDSMFSKAMPYAVEIIVAVVLVAFTCWWMQVVKRRKMLTKWITPMPGLPIIGNVFDFGSSTETLFDLMRFKEKHGNMFYMEFLGKGVVFCTDYNFLEFLLSSSNVIKKARDYKFFESWLGTGLLLSTGTKWKKRRRLITPAFHFSILEKYIETFERNGTIMVDRLKKEVDSDGLDIYPFVTACTLDIICETAMGVSVNAQQNQDAEYVTSVKKMCRIAIDRSFSLLKGFDIFYIFSRDFYKERKLLQILHGFSNSVITKRIEELKDTKINSSEAKNEDDNGIGRRKKLAFLDLLINSTVEGHPLTQEDIREEVDTFMFEGHDTTASAIAFTLYVLAENKDVQERAFEEQKELFLINRDRKSTYQDLQNMKYLEEVIKESLRLLPSVPVISREVTEDVEYKGLRIPKGTTLAAFIYGINRDPEFHENPEKFDPTRFEKNEGKYPYSYIPFSAGPRNCIGQKFAMLEMKSALSKILRNFEISPTNPKHKMILASEAVLKSVNGVKIRLKIKEW